MNNRKVSLTVLNSMAGQDIETAFDRHVTWGLRFLDLKNCIFGKSVDELTVEEAKQVKEAADRRGLQVHTLSTCLLHGDVEQGEKAFRDRDIAALQNVLDVADILSPVQIRLLAASSNRRHEILDSSVYLTAHHPWLVNVYRDAVDQIRDAGYGAVIENEAHDCLFATPAETVSFFSTLDRTSHVGLVWDIQNLWQMGTFPTLDVYETLKPLIRMIHLKGGRAEVAGGALKWRSHLQDASWPVLPIVRRVIEDGRSPVICLNPSHGQSPPGFNSDPQNDIEFLRNAVKEIA